MQLTNISYGDEPFDISYRLFVDMNQQRFHSVANPTYVVELTQNLLIGDTNIFVTNGTVLGTPDPSLVIPGIIHVNGERIVYYEKDGNRLSRLRRGVGGTGVPMIHLAGSDVEDVGPNRYNNDGKWVPAIEYRAFPSAVVVSEGNVIRFQINTRYVLPGVTLYWTNAGTAQILDFVGFDTGFLNRGSFVMGGDYNNGVAYVDLTPRLDTTTEGNETIVFQVRTGSFTGPVVATAETVTIEDIGIIPTYFIEPRSNVVAEGSSVVFDVSSRGIADNTTLYWTNEGTSTPTDFAIQTSSGTVTVTGGYRESTGFIRLDTVRNLGLTRGKSIVLNLREGSASGPILLTANVVYISDLPDPAYDIRATVESYGGWAGNTQSILADEGETVRFDFLTVGVEPKTLFFYEITGTTSTADYSGSQNPNWGSFKTEGTMFGASANVKINILEDVTTETGPPESFIFTVYSTRSFDSGSYIIGPVTVNINDTSVAAVVSVAASTTNVSEGDSVIFTITTDGIKPGTTMWCTATGTADAADFDTYPVGTFTMGGTYRAGTATVTFKTKQDLTPLAPDPEEGPETLIFTVYTKDPTSTPTPPPAAPAITVTINDTSKVTTTTTEPPPQALPEPGKVLNNFFNGDFEIIEPQSTDADGVDHIPGWSIYKPGVGNTPSHLRLSGFSNILGCPTPTDPTPEYESRTRPGSRTPAPYADQDPPVSGFSFNWEIVNQKIDPYGGKNVMRLFSNGTSVPFGVVRGPYLVADNPIDCKKGDKVYFHWKAEYVSDDFDVFAYLLSTTDCKTVLLLDSSSSAIGAAASDWTRVEKEIKESEVGIYKFVFVCGTQDATGGRALGARLYLDNIDKISAAPPPTPWSLTVDSASKSGPTTFTFLLTVPSYIKAKTLSWYIVDPSTTTQTSLSGIGPSNRGAENNLPITDGPASVTITINAGSITGFDQVFQMLVTEGSITATEVVRSPVFTLKPAAAPVWFIGCGVCSVQGGGDLEWTWGVNAGVINSTASWYAVNEGTNTPFTGTGLSLPDRGSSNNLPNVTGPKSTKITVTTNPVSSLQKFQIIIVGGPLPTDTELARSPTMSITV